ncbi:MAG: 30S ribosomal protein S17 [Syntrophobacteria bacterium]
MKRRGLRKTQTGIVISDKMDKTVVVRVDRLAKHPLYKKYVRRRAKYMAHDENNSSRVGDRVLIRETRPLSKAKRWQVSRVIEKGIT